MTKISLTDLVNLQNETTSVNAINANNATLETALTNTLSRDGTTPNTMSAYLDMNSNQIINLPAPSTTSSPARLIDVVSNPTIVIPGTGTSGHTVPFLDGNNTWSGTNTFSLAIPPAFPFGPRLAKTANYTVASADDGNTIALDGSAFFTLTFPTASTLNATHKNVILNEDTTRAKNIVITGGTNFFLYPGQTAVVYNSNNVWQVTRSSRWRLTAAVTLNVDVTNGNDANDGLATGSSNALATLQKAWDTAADYFDLAGQTLTIQLADGTYTAGLATSKTMLGSNGPASIVIVGNVGTPGNVSIATTGHAIIFGGTSGCQTAASIQSMKLSSTTASALSAFGPCSITFNNLQFGACPSLYHINAQHGAYIESVGNYAVVGNATNHANAKLGGKIVIGGRTVTYSNSPVFTTNLWVDNGSIFANAMTFTNGGTVTGQRYNVIDLGYIDTGGSGATYVPGNSAGSVAAGGIYN